MCRHYSVLTVIVVVPETVKPRCYLYWVVVVGWIGLLHDPNFLFVVGWVGSKKMGHGHL